MSNFQILISLLCVASFAYLLLTFILKHRIIGERTFFIEQVLDDITGRNVRENLDSISSIINATGNAEGNWFKHFYNEYQEQCWENEGAWYNSEQAGVFLSEEHLLPRGILHDETPSTLTGIGVLGTFLGIVSGLHGFKFEQFETSVGALIAGLEFAFFTSIGGLLLSLVCVFLKTRWLQNFNEKRRGLIRVLDDTVRRGVTPKLLVELNQTAGNIHLSLEQVSSKIVEDLCEGALLPAIQTMTESLVKAIKETQEKDLEASVQSFKQEILSLTKAVSTLCAGTSKLNVQLEDNAGRHREIQGEIENASHTARASLEETVSQFSSSVGQIRETFIELHGRSQDSAQTIEEGMRALQHTVEVSDRATQAIADSTQHLLTASRQSAEIGEDVQTRLERLSDQVDEYRGASNELRDSMNLLGPIMAGFTGDIAGTMNEMKDEQRAFLEGLSNNRVAMAEISDKFEVAAKEMYITFLDHAREVDASSRSRMEKELQKTFGEVDGLLEKSVSKFRDIINSIAESQVRNAGQAR